MDKTAIFHPYSGETSTVLNHPAYVNSITAIPGEFMSGDLVVTGSDDEDLRVWSTENPSKARAVVEGHCGAILAIRLWEEAGVLVTGSLDGTLRKWSIAGELAFASRSGRSVWCKK